MIPKCLGNLSPIDKTRQLISTNVYATPQRINISFIWFNVAKVRAMKWKDTRIFSQNHEHNNDEKIKTLYCISKTTWRGLLVIKFIFFSLLGRVMRHLFVCIFFFFLFFFFFFSFFFYLFQTCILFLSPSNLFSCKLRVFIIIIDKLSWFVHFSLFRWS